MANSLQYTLENSVDRESLVGWSGIAKSDMTQVTNTIEL